MQRLIDVDKLINDGINKGFCDWWHEIKNAETVLTIPDNPTNGNVFESLIDVDKDCVEVHGENGTMTFVVTQEWWDSPFKRGTDGSNNN